MKPFERQNGVYYMAYCDNGRRRWLSLRTRDPDEAERRCRLLAPSLYRPKRTTLSSFLGQLSAYTSSNLSKGTQGIYSRSITMLQETIGNVPLRQMRTQDIEKFKQSRLREVSAVTVNISLRTLRSAFNLAVDWGLLDNNPAHRCKLLRVPHKDPFYLMQDEFMGLCQTVPDIQFRRLLLLAALTGMRRSEITNLHWEDLDFDRLTIRIRNRSGFVVKGLMPRTIPMPNEIHRQLRPLRKANGHVFTKPTGGPLSPESVTHRFKRYARKFGLPPEAHFHSLRHSFASWLIQAGVPMFGVQHLLGHSSITTTQLYTHIEDEGLRKSIEVLSLPGIQEMTH